MSRKGAFAAFMAFAILVTVPARAQTPTNASAPKAFVRVDGKNEPPPQAIPKPSVTVKTSVRADGGSAPLKQNTTKPSAPIKTLVRADGGTAPLKQTTTKPSAPIKTLVRADGGTAPLKQTTTKPSAPVKTFVHANAGAAPLKQTTIKPSAPVKTSVRADGSTASLRQPANSTIISPVFLSNIACIGKGEINRVATNTDGTVAAAGVCGNLGVPNHAVVTRLNSDGKPLWSFDLGVVHVNDLAFDNGGNVVAADTVQAGPSKVGRVEKIGSTAGNPIIILWQKTITPPGPGDFSCVAVTADSSGAVYASCLNPSTQGGSLIAYGPDGTQLWRKDEVIPTLNIFTKGGNLYASSIDRTRILDGPTGAVLSETQLPAPVRLGQDGTIYGKTTLAPSNASISLFDDNLTQQSSVVLKGTAGAARSYDYFDVDARGNIFVFGAYYNNSALQGGGQYVGEFSPAGTPLWEYTAKPDDSFNPKLAPAASNVESGGTLVSASSDGKYYVSSFASRLALFPAQ